MEREEGREIRKCWAWDYIKDFGLYFTKQWESIKKFLSGVVGVTRLDMHFVKNIQIALWRMNQKWMKLGMVVQWWMKGDSWKATEFISRGIGSLDQYDDGLEGERWVVDLRGFVF